MSNTLTVAHARGWDLATTLMACVVVFETEGGYGVLPTAEFDGDPETAVHEFDPFAI